MKVFTYKLDYVLWDMDTNLSQLIKDDIVSYPFPKDHNDIFTEVQNTWKLLRGDNIQVGDMDISIMAV